MSGRHQLPDGTTTISDERYLKEWRRVARPIVDGCGWRVVSFDPGFTFVDRSGKTLHLSVTQALDVGTAIVFGAVKKERKP